MTIDRAELDRITASVERRESKLHPIEVSITDVFPTPVVAGLTEFARYCMGALKIAPAVKLRFFAARDIDTHVGHFHRLWPGEIWVRSGLTPQQTGLVIGHELVHASGVCDETEATRRAIELLAEWDQPLAAPHYGPATSQSPYVSPQPLI